MLLLLGQSYTQKKLIIAGYVNPENPGDFPCCLGMMEFVYYFAGKKSSQIFWKVLVPKSCKIGSLSKIPIVFAQLSGVVWPILMINRFNMSEFTTFLAPTKIKVYILQYYRHQQMSSSISEHHEPL